MRVILVIVCMVLGLGAYAQRDTAAMVSDVYKGVLPCADCSGIQTELILLHEANAGMGKYTLREVYTGKDSTVFETEGEWTHHRGMQGNKNATVIDLYDPGNADTASRYFLRLKDGDLKMLDRDLKTIKSTANYVLKKEK